MPVALAPAAPLTSADPVAVASAAVRAFLVAGAAVYPQRGDVLRAFALADVCPASTNVLLLGPPGTAKTTLARDYARSRGLSLCLRTLSAWTDDSALLGPVDVAALARGTLSRTGTGYLPDADLVVLDELPRAGRGVRDLCLSVLADRVTPDGIVCPAHVVVATANTRLVDADDAALVDRFALRVSVPRVTGADLRAVITRRVPVDGVRAPSLTLPALPVDAVDVLRAHAHTVDMPGTIADALVKIAETLRMPAPAGQRHPDVSERRLIVATGLLQASAAIAGRSVVSWEDLLSVLPFVLDDGDDCAVAVRNAVAANIPAYVNALADLRAACDAALILTRRVEIDRAPTTPAQAQAHAARDATLGAMADAVREHGADAHREALAVVAAALDACDDAVETGLRQARQARRT